MVFTSQLQNKALLLIPFIAFLSVNSFAGSGKKNIRYVQANTVYVKSANKMNADTITQLKRGTRVKILKKKGLWYKIKVNKKKGWVSKLFLSKNKPVEYASLVQEVPENIEKASRRRPSSYSVSASTRGLIADKRGRPGRELYQSDFEALEKLEKLQFTDNQLKQFQENGNLTID